MANISMSDAELLKYAVENGMLDATLVQEMIEMQKREEILKKHPYKVWEGKDGYWRTYLPDGDGRKLIKKKTKDAIDDVIVEYFGTVVMNTFKDRFFIWVDRQKKCGRSDNTINKYKADYKRFFEGDSIEYTPIQNITDVEISEYIKRLLERKSIPYRALKALFGYLNGIFEKSIIDKIISVNPCKYVDLPIYKQYCKEEKPKIASERTVSNKEKNALIHKLNKNYEKNPVILTRYAVELSLYTGMRVGELSGLKWEDIDYENCVISICRSEKYNRETKEYFISSTKNDKIRTFPLTEEIKEVLSKVKKVEMKNGYLSEFVFSDENGRVHARRISECARNLTMTKEFGHTKSIHAIRRTFNSELRCNGVSATVAASLLGHTEKVNEQNYTNDVTDIGYKTLIVSEINRKTAEM